MLVYCSYPLLWQEKEPDWVQVATHVAKEMNFYVYRPYLELDHQNLTEKYFNQENNTKVNNILKVLGIEDHLVPNTLEDAVTLSNHKGNSLKLITKEVWILVNSSLVIVDCDLPSSGDRDMILTVARLAGIPVVGVSNNFLVGPWLTELTNLRGSTKDLPNLLRLLISSLKEVPNVED